MDDLRLVDENDPVLRVPTQPFDFSDPPVDPIVLVPAMFKLMFASNGAGLAAPQVGLPYRVFVMVTSDGRQFACFNPESVVETVETAREDEGCLSFPNLWLKVSRPIWIAAEFTDEFGNLVNEKFEKFDARCYLHETDHLNGKLFVERVGPLTLKRALGRRHKRL